MTPASAPAITMHSKLLILSIAVLPFLNRSAIAATHTIENKSLAVSFNDVAGTFSVAEKATGKCFLTAGKLEGAPGKARV